MMNIDFNIESWNAACFGYAMMLNLLNIPLTFRVKIYECLYGVVGLASSGDYSDCKWRDYEVSYPIYQYDILGYKTFWEDTFVDKCSM